ncbi:MAG: hypothetical protein EOO38_19635, partial [Cytophagaceae bacterium]
MTTERRRIFGRDLAFSIGSSGLGFVLTLATTPIMTRLFHAEAYGVNAMMLTCSTLISAFGLFGLPAALARDLTTNEEMRLLKASVQLSVILGSLSVLAVGLIVI